VGSCSYLQSGDGLSMTYNIEAKKEKMDKFEYFFNKKEVKKIRHKVKEKTTNWGKILAGHLIKS
jgi:hypothetical protein